jgi:hypothetical protein
MKKLSIVLSLVAAFGLAMVACGDDDDKNVCEQAGEVAESGMDSYCSGRVDECYFCDCWINNDQIISMDATDQCADPDPIGDCTGQNETNAQACLDDEASCRADAEAAAQALCDASQK